MREIEAQVRKFYDEIWNRKNLDEILNVVHKDITFRGSIGVCKSGIDGFQAYLLYIHSVLDNYTCTIEDLVIEDNKAFAKMTFSGIHKSEFLEFPATNKQVEWSAAALFTFDGIKVADLWVLGDIATLTKQLAGKKSFNLGAYKK